MMENTKEKTFFMVLGGFLMAVCLIFTFSENENYTVVIQLMATLAVATGGYLIGFLEGDRGAHAYEMDNK